MKKTNKTIKVPMRAKEVLEKLGITRPTLSKYVKEGKIGVSCLAQNRYIYDGEDVLSMLSTSGTPFKKQSAAYRVSVEGDVAMKSLCRADVYLQDSPRGKVSFNKLLAMISEGALYSLSVFDSDDIKNRIGTLSDLCKAFNVEVHVIEHALA